MNIAGILRPVGRFIVRHASGILMASGTVLSIGAIASAICDAPKGMDTADEMRTEIEMIDSQDRSKVSEKDIRKMKFGCVTKNVWKQIKNFARTIALAIAAFGCIWGAHIIDIRNIATVANMYEVAVQERDRYRRHVDEKYGTEVEQQIHDEVRQEVTEDFYPNFASLPFVNKRKPGDSGFHCLLTDTYFWDTPKAVNNSVTLMNKEIDIEGQLEADEGIGMMYPSNARTCQCLLGRVWDANNRPRPTITPVALTGDGNVLGYEIDWYYCMPTSA